MRTLSQYRAIMALAAADPDAIEITGVTPEEREDLEIDYSAIEARIEAMEVEMTAHSRRNQRRITLKRRKPKSKKLFRP